MKVAIVAPVHTSDFGLVINKRPRGYGYRGAPFIATLALALREQGHEVCIFTLQKDGDIATEIMVGEKVTIVVCPSRPSAMRPSKFKVGMLWDSYEAECRALSDAIIRYVPDVVHAHWTYEFALAALQAGYPTIISAHDSPRAVFQAHRSIRNYLRLRLSQKVIGSLTKIAPVSPYIGEELKMHVRGSLLETLANPLPDQIVHKSISIDECLSRPPKFVYISNYWTRLKRPETALLAFAQVKQTMPDASLYCIGADFGPGGKGEKWAKSHGVQEGVDFLGQIDHSEVLGILETSFALLQPSVTESFGMAVAEAMSLGVVPIVHHESGALPWLINYGEAGLLVDDLNPSIIAAKIKNLYKDANLRASLITAARLRIKTLCAKDAVAMCATSLYSVAIRDHNLLRMNIAE